MRWLSPARHEHLQERDEEGRQRRLEQVRLLVNSRLLASLTSSRRSSLCVHFKMSRVDLFQVVKVKRLHDFRSVMRAAGSNPDSIGCELCKPAVASILASLYNDFVMKPRHHGLQDTNDRFLANIQRNGTFSVVPRIAGGEVTPEGLIAIGQGASNGSVRVLELNIVLAQSPRSTAYTRRSPADSASTCSARRRRIFQLSGRNSAPCVASCFRSGRS